MSILIEGMEMPTACMKDCPFQYFGDCYGGKIKRIMDVEDYKDKRHPRCPLIEVPTPHGRLIDADDLIPVLAAWIVSEDDFQAVLDAVERIPTVIESEE